MLKYAAAVFALISFHRRSAVRTNTSFKRFMITHRWFVIRIRILHCRTSFPVFHHTHAKSDFWHRSFQRPPALRAEIQSVPASLRSVIRRPRRLTLVPRPPMTYHHRYLDLILQPCIVAVPFRVISLEIVHRLARSVFFTEYALIFPLHLSITNRIIKTPANHFWHTYAAAYITPIRTPPTAAPILSRLLNHPHPHTT